MSTIRALAPLLAILGIATAAAQPTDSGKGCAEGWGGGRNREHACEVRELTVRPSGTLSVDASPNGGVRVTGTDRKDVLVRAIVHTWAQSEDDARAMF